MSDNTVVATEYYYNGSVLIGMKIGTGSSAKVLRFSYDASGNVVAVDYSTNNGSSFTTYYYLRNAQNDVIKLIDGSGNTVVEYTYDSWGKIISSTGTLANTVGTYQPFRYRGYVYDTETQWYYLQSRYYDPATCRFISADVLLSTGQGVIGHNAFAYCLNNPGSMRDDEGNTAEDLCRASTKDGGSMTVICLLAAIAVMALCFNYTTKPINRPSVKRISIDMDHIISGHSDGGNRGGPNKSRFPKWMTPLAIERAIRFAYKNAEKIGGMRACWDNLNGETIKQLLEGTWGDMKIRIWINYTLKTIESAWPKY